jgi:phospholipase/carboxylesterase
MDQPIARLTRRHFVGLGAVGAVVLFAGGRLAGAAEAGAGGAGRFKARPGKPAQTVKPGVTDLGLAQGRDASLYVPANYDPGKPWPFLVMLHGANGRIPGFRAFSRMASAAGMVVLEPDARRQTWDFDFSGGGDLAFLDRALADVFARVNVDPRRLALGGFSDGGSYALSAGLPNGDLFTHLLAFSPGFMQPPSRQGKPAIWVSHGTRDEILPVEASRERIVPQLKQWGYAVHYREFDGPHGVTPEVVKESFHWFVG